MNMKIVNTQCISLPNQGPEQLIEVHLQALSYVQKILDSLLELSCPPSFCKTNTSKPLAQHGGLAGRAEMGDSAAEDIYEMV